MKSKYFKIIGSYVFGFSSAILARQSLAAGTTINIPNPIKATSTLALINTITNYLLWIAVVGAPLVLVIAALMFLTAGGNDRKVGTAKKMLLWAVIGLTVALVSKGIVSLIKDFLQSTI